MGWAISKYGIALGVLALSMVAAVSPASTQALYKDVVLPAHPTKADVRQFLASLESSIRSEFEYHSNNRFVGGQVTVRTPPKDVMRQLYDKFAAVPIEYIDDLCKASADTESPLFSQIIADSLGARRDYRPTDRSIVLKYLARIPKLILVLDRMDWLDVKDPAVLSAWKKARRDTSGGMLDTVGYRFAALTARRGLVDGLVALANTTKLRSETPASAGRDAKLKGDGDVLRALMPSTLKPVELAEFILKSKSKILFDPITHTFSAPGSG